MNQSLTDNLVSRLDGIRDSYLTAAPAERKTIIDRFCKEITFEYEEKVAANLVNIIQFYLLVQKVDFDSLLKFLKVNEGVDYQTVLREEREGFDRQYGTVTSPIITQYELPEEVSIQRFQTSGRYHPSPVSSVNAALQVLAQYDVKYEEYEFIDIGSGLGRNLLLASKYAFKKIIGIEHSTYLHGIAEENIRVFKSQNSGRDVFELLCIDALTYQFPMSKLVLYFWKPFVNELAVLFFRKIEEFVKDSQLRVVLVFLGPVYPVVDKSIVFKRLTKFETPDFFLSEEERFTVTIYSGLE